MLCRTGPEQLNDQLLLHWINHRITKTAGNTHLQKMKKKKDVGISSDSQVQSHKLVEALFLRESRKKKKI